MKAKLLESMEFSNGLRKKYVSTDDQVEVKDFIKEGKKIYSAEIKVQGINSVFFVNAAKVRCL